MEVISTTASSDSKLHRSLSLDYRRTYVLQFKSVWYMSQHAPHCHILCNLKVQVRTAYKPIINWETYFRLKVGSSKQASMQESKEHAVWATEVSMNTRTHILLVEFWGRKQIFSSNLHLLLWYAALAQLVWVRPGKHKSFKTWRRSKCGSSKVSARVPAVPGTELLINAQTQHPSCLFRHGNFSFILYILLIARRVKTGALALRKTGPRKT